MKIACVAMWTIGALSVELARAEDAPDGLFAPPPPPAVQTTSPREIGPSPYSSWQRNDGASPMPTSETPNARPAPDPRIIAPISATPTVSIGQAIAPERRAPNASVATAKPLEGSEIVARVGNEVILASEILWEINRFLSDKAAEAPPEEVATVRREMMRAQIMRPPAEGNIGLIDTKLLYGEVRAFAPAERLDEVRGRLATRFEEQLIPRLMEFLKAKDREDLERILRKDGSSVEQQRQAFVEREVAMGWLGEKVDRDPEVSHGDMLAYYQEHLAEYEFPAQVTWDELMVRFDRFNGDRAAAQRAIVEMGNDIFVNKLPFAEVAKKKSHGFTAADGGRREKTTQGSLAAANIDAALFSLPVGAMSQLIESDLGWHIVRVVERTPAGRTSFAEAQPDIRKLLKKEKRTRQIKEYIAKLRRQTKVWTVFSGEMTAEELIAGGKDSHYQ